MKPKAEKHKEVYLVKALIPYMDESTLRDYIKKSPYRIIAIPSNYSLYDLAYWITQSFNFDFDHLFAFYDNYRTIHNSKYVFRKNLKKIKISEMFQLYKPGKKWLFLYDFSDEWHFWISLVEVKQIKASYKDNSDMFGSMEYHVEIISIHEKVKTLEKGVHSKCKYGGKIIHVPLHILQFKSTSKHNTRLLQKYLEWFKK
ncbi:MAG: hypothetical protein ABII90_14130 [Bacteroidota bacterium]